MKKIITIAKWEYLEKIKTKAFIISLVITPLIIIMFSVLPTLLSEKEDLRTKVVGVVDTSETYFYQLVEELEEYKIDDNQPNYVLLNLTNEEKTINELKSEADQNVIQNRIEGYLFISNGGTDTVAIEYRSENIGSFKDLRLFEETINKIRVQKELNAKGIDPKIAELIQNNVQIEQIKIEKSGKEGKQDFMIVFFSAFIFILLLMMMVIYSSPAERRRRLSSRVRISIPAMLRVCSIPIPRWLRQR